MTSCRRGIEGRRTGRGAAERALVFAVAMSAACGGRSDADGIGQGDVLAGSRDEGTVREQCEVAGSTVQSVDVNNDGRPDIRHVIAGGTRRCTEIDMNFDGRADVTRFYDADGQTSLREEHDFDFDGRMDQIAYYEGGELVRKELDTNFDSRIDTWMWCEDGRVARAERDRTNDGDADTWETYDRGLLVEARYDDNNDGVAEKAEVFADGQLRAVRYDLDGDGSADREDVIPPEQAGPRDEPIICVVAPEAEDSASSGGEAPAAGEPTDGEEAGDEPGSDAESDAESDAAPSEEADGEESMPAGENPFVDPPDEAASESEEESP